MHPHFLPLNPEQKQRLQQWLSLEGAGTLRKLIGDMIVAEKCEAIRQLISAINDEQYMKDAKEHAQEVLFLERVLTLLGEIQMGHKADRPDEPFDYKSLEKITAIQPNTTNA